MLNREPDADEIALAEANLAAAEAIYNAADLDVEQIADGWLKE